MKVLFCSSEVVPFAKTGGLADVAGALPHALKQIGAEVCVFMPKYKEVTNYLSKNNIACKTKAEGLSFALDKGMPVYFIENEKYYDRDGLYGTSQGDFPDNLERFSYFSKKTLEALKTINFKPDIVHCHDWQAAMIIVYLKNILKDDSFYKNIKTVFTIHNLAYQGLFDHSEYYKLGLNDSLFNIEGLEFYNKISFLKGGIIYSDAVTTVSPTYAKEIQTKEFGCGLEGLLFSRRNKLKGIINGLDYDLWDPTKDSLIFKKFDSNKLTDKYVNKTKFQKECGLPASESIPLFGMVSRLAAQKGVDILSDAMDAMCNMKLQVVILGTGDIKYHQMLEEVARKHKNFCLYLKFDNTLAHKIYASCDFFLMPSKYEPCGLGQMISMKYGNLPIVFKTGGLADTVADYQLDPTKGNGLVLEEYSRPALIETVKRAIKLFSNKNKLDKVILNAMSSNFSWEESAKDYLKLFKKLKKS